jgi:hypothetical protein
MYCMCCKDKRKKVLSGAGNKSFFVCSKSQGGCGNEIDDEKVNKMGMSLQGCMNEFKGIPYIEVTVQLPTNETVNIDQASSRQLEEIASNYGLLRYYGEYDTELRKRLKAYLQQLHNPTGRW